ncbi:low molecular weight protein-tyrosine-phosphatase [Oceanimonas baumannii]|uniref:protein-tyrosine-phosphatase n=1 Tax=Oceanimonas baumannii TaxID=129578 RepID=A0A235CH54_9GAMM|nr:low molecular weight protein-tyrosine-phosphatase [Oceanimonas baumannii]OYD23941.1 protein-tyrosine-phosphatase [Oceanimonas baumannii]TDW58727.1 protein-tyrosine phosphatase [Oceanimonas baumannii]
MDSNHLKTKDNHSILIVCMGNICRSPTAEAVFRHKAASAGLNIDIDSAGTIGYHAGSGPDARARAAGEARGYDFSGMQARQITVSDFARFDLVLAADKENLRDLQRLCPAEHAHKVKLLLSFANGPEQEVPDPYYGGEQGFELVLDLVEDACDGVLKHIRCG